MWRGPQCEQLNALPTHENHGFTMENYNKQNNTQHNAWGATVMKDEKQGLYHMYVSVFWNATVWTWYKSSVIVHAVSDKPSGPFKFQKVLLNGTGNKLDFDATAVHNPHLVRLNTGKFLLFYIGLNCLEWPDKQCEGHQSIGLLYSDSVGGPWQRHGPVLRPSEEYTWESGVVANPAVIVQPDDSLWLYYRGHRDKGVGVAIAQSWRGPYIRHGYANRSIIDGPHVLEDMFVWKCPLTHTYHMLCHTQMHGWIKVGGHGYSVDGLQWHLAEEQDHPLSSPTIEAAASTTKRRKREDPVPVFSYTTVIWTKETRKGNKSPLKKYHRRERPYLVLDWKTGFPIWFFTAVQLRASRVGTLSPIQRTFTTRVIATQVVNHAPPAVACVENLATDPSSCGT
eukprot:TRINITY_DN63466_c0_g1_i1.p1 TRINITY_DN63466_c0_g1~~TRINITY_DN63466_c0_g1_i1.p1  ORF type:complete len:396 (-),score=12.84 TRINITY_DN63466_c0_g1_i1:38-1225(-)